jgi:arsenite-transporting ATPase
VLFFGGKGGVGKTTCSSALALAAARIGKRVLLVSTDPAHSTSDILETRLGPEERRVLPNLFGLEIDGDTEVRRYLDDAKRRMGALFSPAVIREAARQIELTASMPGVAEVALFDRMASLVEARAGDFDLIVFDTAPTGHALRLLRLPELMSAWVDALARRRRESIAASRVELGAEGSAASADPDPILSALEERSRRLSSMRHTLSRADHVSFVLVMIPERLPIEESARAAHALAETGIEMGGIVVNRVLPEHEPGDFLRARKAQEAVYLDEIARRFTATPRVLVPQLESDVHGLASLERIGTLLLADV